MTRIITNLRKFGSKLWMHHLPVPASIGEKYVDGNNRRVFCTINNQMKIQSSLMPYADGFFILINKNLINQLHLKLDEEVSLVLEKDTTEYGLEMPESFRALLDQDEEGSGYFEKLTPGKKRGLIYIAGKVKNIDSQVNKGMAILDHLKSEQGKLDYKKLHELIKVYNQRLKLK